MAERWRQRLHRGPHRRRTFGLQPHVVANPSRSPTTRCLSRRCGTAGVGLCLDPIDHAVGLSFDETPARPTRARDRRFAMRRCCCRRPDAQLHPGMARSGLFKGYDVARLRCQVVAQTKEQSSVHVDAVSFLRESIERVGLTRHAGVSRDPRNESLVRTSLRLDEDRSAARAPSLPVPLYADLLAPGSTSSSGSLASSPNTLSSADHMPAHTRCARRSVPDVAGRNVAGPLVQVDQDVSPCAPLSRR